MLHFRNAALATLFSLAVAVPAAAQNRWVTIVNNTGYTITYFYATNKGDTSFGNDILGNDVLPPGYSVDVNFDDGTGYCMFDFQARFEDGDVLEKYDVNVCEISTFYYN